MDLACALREFRIAECRTDFREAEMESVSSQDGAGIHVRDECDLQWSADWEGKLNLFE